MKHISVEYNNKKYKIDVLNADLKIYMDTFENSIGGLTVVYYDEKSNSIKRKNFNSNNFTNVKVSTQALNFLKNIYNMDRNVYIRIIDMYAQKLNERNKIPIKKVLSTNLNNVKEKHIFKV